MSISYEKQVTELIEPTHIDPCPFCEETVAFRVNGDGHMSRVFCRECGCYGPYAPGGWENAVKAWNNPRTLVDLRKG
jgi:hypothetical protein